MMKIFNYTVACSDSGKTIEAYLKNLGYSRSVLIHLKQTPNGMSIGGKKVCTTRQLMSGEVLTIMLQDTSASKNILPVPLTLSILYEDEDFLIINKEAGVPVHPSQGNFDNTLANGVAWYFQAKGESFVFRAISRLDRDTTGLILLAKHMLSAAILSDMAIQKKIRKEYLAIADGKTDESGTICKPIARLSGSTIERCVDEVCGEYACTHFRRVSYDAKTNCSLLSLTLDTGRTHQIRVHMKSIGHPLIGDFLYNPDYRFISRHALHAHRLSFCHPFTGEKLVFTAPLPKDFHFLSPLG